jgi:hypothetical protein
MSCQYCKNTTSNVCPNCLPKQMLNWDNSFNIDYIYYFYKDYILINTLKKLDNIMCRQLDLINKLIK